MTDELTLGKTFSILKNLFIQPTPTLDSLQDDVLKFRAETDAKRKHADDHLYITDFAYKPCLRRLAYYYLRPDLQDKKDPKMLCGMDAGSHIHAWVQDEILGPMGVLEGLWECTNCGRIEEGARPKGACFGKVKVFNDLKDTWIVRRCKDVRGSTWKFKEQHVRLEFSGIVVTGRPDGRLIVAKERVLEIKSMEEEKFNALTEPRDYHIFQASVYGEKLGVNEVIILYVNWNHWWQMKTFVVPVLPGILKSIENSCESIRFLLDQKDPLRAAPICKNRSAWKARECGARDICFPLKRKRKSDK